MKKLYLVLGMVALIGFSFTPVMADEAINEESAGEKLQVKWIGAAEFENFRDGWEVDLWADREIHARVGAPPHNFPDVSAVVHLPSGASLERVDMFAYDGVGAWGENLQLQLNKENWNNGAPVRVNICTLRTDVANNGPGYEVVVGAPIAALKPIRNFGGYYSAIASFGTNGTQGVNLSLFGVRLVYQLQVNPNLPNPFTDIGHLNPRFQEAIAALSASGITNGCNPAGDEFCPDRAITRGEMAVFLAEALGLYWDATAGF